MPIEPVRSLGQTGRVFWDSAVSGHRIDNPAGVELLQLACEGLDRLKMLEARQASGDADPKLTRDITQTVALVASLLVKLDRFVTPTRGKHRPLARPGRPLQNFHWDGPHHVD
jgi:hypothetical protein